MMMKKGTYEQKIYLESYTIEEFHRQLDVDNQ